MKNYMLAAWLLLWPFWAPAQETVTFSVDSIAPKVWQLTTLTSYVRSDSSVWEKKESLKFKNRGEVRTYVKALFQERIRTDSTLAADASKRVAQLKTTRQLLLATVNKPNAAPRKVDKPPDAPVKKKQ